MDVAIQICSYVLGLSLQVLVISAMLRGPYRRYSFGFAYLVVGFVTAVAEIPASFAYHSGHNKTLYPRMYWIDEGVREVLVFSVVISLIFAATSKLGSRRLVRLGLCAGGALFVGISFLIHYSPDLKTGMWMTPWTRDMKLCATILDLALWALLIASRKTGQQLLLLSGGLGIKFAGEAISESIHTLAARNHYHNIVTLGSVVGLLAGFSFLYIWWQTFRKEPAAKKISAAMPVRQGVVPRH
jgi:hypothetical protein